ncbi:MAG: metal-dependent transcriptional regulator [Actinomycetota bacterium]|nr:metal-dependent transcriptional regulator [Actinomycetota bacterium]
MTERDTAVGSVTEKDEPYRATFREYVEAIYELEEEGIEPIQARIGDWLGVSRPSVSEMVHRMEGEGLVSVDRAITLTAEGRHLAEVVVRRHRLAERFLAEILGLPWVKVHHEAETWEHMISADVEEAMWRVLGDPKTCPHGNPIPGAGYKPPRMKAIAMMEVGELGRLERISEELELEDQTMDFLDRARLRPGANVRLTERSPHGASTVQVLGGQAVGLDDHVAQRVFIAIS